MFLKSSALLCVAQLWWGSAAHKTSIPPDASMPNGADIMRREKKADSNQPASLLGTRTSARYRQTKKTIFALERQVRQNQKRTHELAKQWRSIQMQDATRASFIEEETRASNEEAANRNLLERLDKLNRTATTSACNAFTEDSDAKVLQLSKGRSLWVYKSDSVGASGGGAGGNLIVGEGHVFAGCSNSFMAGFTNTCKGDSHVALGGQQNIVGHTDASKTNIGAAIIGGDSCHSLRDAATIVGGYGNKVETETGTILGGFNGELNDMSDASYKPVLVGGVDMKVTQAQWIAPDDPCNAKQSHYQRTR